jgi:hypothetical protein
MRLSVPKIDGRTILGANLQHEIVDEDTGSVVGFLSAANGSSLSNSRSRYVDLFDGKYRGEFDSHAECAAFSRNRISNESIRQGVPNFVGIVASISQLHKETFEKFAAKVAS